MRAIRRLRARFDEKDERHGLSYPWWVGLFSKVLQVVIALLAVSQRGGLEPSWTWLGVVLVVAPHVVQGVIRPWLPWYVTAVSVIGGGALIMATPTDARVDVAPAILVVIVAEIMATDGIARGLVTTVAALGVALAIDVDQTQPTAGEIVIGAMVGAMLSWQSRTLIAERAARAREHETAALAERQRIAREIHDLVAHSLSVTLLQVSGARRALLDADVDEASAALADAETVGRAAMDDIRRTVGVLADGPSPSHAPPDASDIASLVESVAAAGLDVRLDVSGELADVPPTAGLHLYRVVQEALTNVVKHGGRGRADVGITVDARATRLRVTNPIAPGASSDGAGHGLVGMRERAQQLGAVLQAEALGSAWVVDLTIPHAPDADSWTHQATCLVRRMVR